MKQSRDKVVVVTGGSSGIGKGIAERFLKEGSKVVIFGRSQERLDQAKKELSEDVLAIQGDVTKTEDLKHLFTKTKSHFGNIDVLIVNSGVAKRMAPDEVTEQDFDYMVDINYRVMKHRILQEWI